jgi:hypothetical protein
MTLMGFWACDNSDTKNGVCDVFTSADSICFCRTHLNDFKCSTFDLQEVTSEEPPLIPHSINGTIWTKGFAIDANIFIIDRESASPHSFWKFDLNTSESWKAMAGFPGTDYGLVGAAGGKGFASSYASTKFWEYDPAKNEWTTLSDLPFSTTETHWVEYNGKYYVPVTKGIYEFNAATKEWTKFSEQTSTAIGSLFLLGDDLYWFNINDIFMNRFNLKDKSFQQHFVPEGFGSSIVFNSPFVIGDAAYIVEGDDLWVFDHTTHTWTVHQDKLKSAPIFPDDVFLVNGKVYLISNGELNVLAVN